MPSLSSGPDLLTLLFVVPIVVWFVTIIFQYLWNCTLPDIFKLREISFWEAFRLLLISGFVFGGSFLRFKSGG